MSHILPNSPLQQDKFAFVLPVLMQIRRSGRWQIVVEVEIDIVLLFAACHELKTSGALGGVTGVGVLNRA